MSTPGNQPTTDRSTASAPRDRKGGGSATLVRRYGPIAAGAVLAVGAVLVLGSNDGGDDEGGDEPAAAPPDHDELVRSGPMTPEKARLLNASVDFGPGCDASLGRINLPTVYAAPCVEPFEVDNGGATSSGVTEDTVKLVAYLRNPDPLTGAVVEGTGADLDLGRQRQTIEGYVDLYNKVFETYDRRVEVEFFTGTGTLADTAAAKADAIAIAEKTPFAVIGAPDQASDAFADELAAREVICLEGCAIGLPNTFLAERAPYVWMSGGSTAKAPLTAEVIGKLAGPGKATMAGDPDMRERDRVYAIVHYNTPDGLQQEPFEAAVDGLDQYGIELATDVEYFLDMNRMQEDARTTIAKLEKAGVTTVIFAGDPVTPTALTEEATAQDYFPEWIHADGYLVDTAQWARKYDSEQWRNGFGLVYRAPPAAGQDVADQLYQWGYGTLPPSNIAGTLESPLRMLFTGIHLAGHRLTPETFRDGVLRMPPSGGGPTRPALAWGDRPWTGLDDPQADAAVVWWDPEAEGVDEGGDFGAGMYRFADGGQRYKAGEVPESPEEAGLFDVGSSVIAYDELPAEDQTPDYPTPR